MQVMQVQSLGQEDPLQKEIAAHSSILAQESPQTEEPGRPTVYGVAKESDHDLVTKQQQYCCIKSVNIGIIYIYL